MENLLDYGLQKACLAMSNMQLIVQPSIKIQLIGFSKPPSHILLLDVIYAHNLHLLIQDRSPSSNKLTRNNESSVQFSSVLD
jgi:hypothetical protein